ncbi:MAG: M23 family metallopeptidase [Bdellovibrio sp.]|nr:M23 family metallopeptidase [Bdellovibrio sp.]
MLPKINIVALLTTLASCANISSISQSVSATDEQEQAKTPGTVLAKEEVQAIAKEAPYATNEVSIRPGEVRFLKFPRPELFPMGELWCGDQKFPVQEQGAELIAFISESYFSEIEQRDCFWKTPSLIYKIANMTIQKRTFPKEFLKVNPKTVELSRWDFERVKNEQQILGIIYANSSKNLFFDMPFKRPLRSRITSYYGIQRVYNNIKKGQHLGIDFRARVGVPVPASNRGKVVLAQDLFFTGLTVIVDHGLGIFSIYGHLSSILVNVGDIVVPTTILGNTGQTGRASGPHLHWGVKVGQHLIDGLQLIEMTEKEFAHDRQNLSSNI